MSGVIVIALYIIFFAMIVVVTNKHYRISIAKSTIGMSNHKRTALKMSYINIAIFTAMFLVIDIILTYGKSINDFGGDRQNYYRMFMGDGGDSLTYGLSKVFDFVRLYSNDIKNVFYLTCVVCFFLLFVSYRISDDATPYAIAFVLLTDIAFIFYVNQKQAYAIALSYLMFAIALKKSNFRRNLLCIALIFLACLFHPSAIILIFSFIMIRLFPKINRKETQVAFYIVAAFMLLLLIFGESTVKFIANIVAKISPSYSDLLLKYLGKQPGQFSDTFTIAFIKGFPYYYVSILGMLRRNKIKQDIDNYDAYLILSIIGSLVYLSSIHSYWLFRGTAYFFFPIGLLFGMIVTKQNGLTNGNSKKRHTSTNCWIVYGSEFVILIRYLIQLFFVNYHGKI